MRGDRQGRQRHQRCRRSDGASDLTSCRRVTARSAV